MPELPEVQTVVDDLIAAGLQGLVISRARVHWPRCIAVPDPRRFCSQLAGCSIEHITRRAKYIVFELSNGKALLLHLRMSGRLHLSAQGDPLEKHEHVVVCLADGRELRLHDTRKFGRCYLLDEADTILSRLGPEPLAAEFTLRVFTSLLKGRRRMLKPMLLDQQVLAGLGNIYVDEALWEAGIHPCRTADSLSAPECKRLHRAIPLVLRRGLRNLGTTLGTGKANFYSVSRQQGRNSDELRVFRRTGLPCPRCGSVIQRLIIAQRSTHICPKCQKAGKRTARLSGQPCRNKP